jgi:membrane protease YdiL (CAAX protease family)
MAKFKNIALISMLVLLTLVLIFHISILTQIVPYDIVWAGKLKTKQEMYVFESVSILINSILISTLLIKGNYLKINISEKLINSILWIFVVLFSLNTLGNLTAKTLFEKAVFTPFTAISAFLIFIIVKPNRNGEK